MKTDPTTTPTTTVPTTTTTVVDTTTTVKRYITFRRTSVGARLTDCAAACPDGWKYWNSKCYKKFNEWGTYYDATLSCSTIGAQLVSISSESENGALWRAFDSNVLVDESEVSWIGLKYVSGNWMNTDGYISGYFNWAPTQPAMGSGQCVQMITDSLKNATYLWQRGGWKTFDCTSVSASYICEMDANI
ncbi:hypothetical protein CAEBREN_24453 [Caenorhabditis brenneri]|uniref:C-type lectin domain-containing protein n=1 Tax=Caenorhabditis brenneri TaxID=135651 RepID=G0NHH3_CAEBE|nr:hypothetical protein CAEBREN_24453 [Caenorhabditis brenneri]